MQPTLADGQKVLFTAEIFIHGPLAFFRGFIRADDQMGSRYKLRGQSLQEENHRRIFTAIQVGKCPWTFLKSRAGNIRMKGSAAPFGLRDHSRGSLAACMEKIAFHAVQ